MSRSLQDSLSALRGAQDAIALEEALKDVTASSAGDSITRTQYINELQHVLDDGTLLNAKLRRKVKRLHEVLVAGPSAAPPVAAAVTRSAAKRAAPSSSQHEPEEEAVPVAPVEKSLETIIAAVRASRAAVDLEASLAPVRPGVGTCSSRRTLKRAVEAAMKVEEVEASMNSRIRRRMARVLKILVSGADPNPPPAPAATTVSAAQEEVPEAKRRRVPYVVFVGQLPFDCTAADLDEHIRKHAALTGPAVVRLLTDTKTQRSKGLAFVSADNAADMHQLLTLHRSVLLGRAINVERSCGGSDKSKRTEKLQEKREAQKSKLREISQRVLDDFAAKQVVDVSKLGETFRTKLLDCSPAVVASALQAYEKLPADSRSLSKLDQLLSRGPSR